MTIVRRVRRLLFVVRCACGRQYQTAGGATQIVNRRHCMGCRPTHPAALENLAKWRART